jgi:hypothetical protein
MRRQSNLLAYLDARARQTKLLSTMGSDPGSTQAAIAAAAADADRALEALNH